MTKILMNFFGKALNILFDFFVTAVSVACIVAFGLLPFLLLSHCVNNSVPGMILNNGF